MKSRLNLTIDEQILQEVKRYARQREVPISELVEDFFKKMIRGDKSSSIVDLVERLDKPVIDKGLNLTDLYYQEQAKKYGF